MSDLVAFLLARLDEDERVARAAIAPGPGPRWDARTGRNIGLVSTAESGQRVASVSRASQVAHIARHDPARVLAEVAAKRQIVEGFVAAQGGHPGECKGEGGVLLDSGLDHQMFGPCVEHEALTRRAPSELILRLLALPYVDHEAYQPEWSP